MDDENEDFTDGLLVKDLTWSILDTGKASPDINMRIDNELLAQMAQKSATPTLHLYDWTLPSITYGHFIDPNKYLHLDIVQKLGIALAKRPTGGGIICHMTDWAFSLVVPSSHPAYSSNILDNYRFVNQIVINVIAEFLGVSPSSFSLLPKEETVVELTSKHFCMAKPTKYDVMWEGKKVAGGAQRRTRDGFLHQGSISLCKPNIEILSQVLLSGKGILEAMQYNTATLLQGTPSADELTNARAELKAIFLLQQVLNKAQTTVTFPR